MKKRKKNKLPNQLETFNSIRKPVPPSSLIFVDRRREKNRMACRKEKPVSE